MQFCSPPPSMNVISQTRIRCTISDSTYEKHGCDNCKLNKRKCDLIKNSTSLDSANPNSNLFFPSTRSKNEVYGSKIQPPTSKKISSATCTNNGLVTKDPSETSSKYEKLPQLVGSHDYTNDKISDSFVGPNSLSASLPRTRPDLPTPTSLGKGTSNIHLKSVRDINHNQHDNGLQVLSMGNTRLLPSISSVIPQSFSSPYYPMHTFQLPFRTHPDVNFNIKPENGIEKHKTTPKEFCQAQMIDGEVTFARIGDSTSNKITLGSSSGEYTKSSEPQTGESYHFSLLSSIESDIEKIDYRFLKEKFDFNSSFRESQYYFTKPGKNGDTEGELISEGISTKKLRRTKFLDRSNLSHFKFLLMINAFTLNSPDVYFIKKEDLVRLFEIYFYKVNSVFPIIFETEFWELHKRDKIPNITIYAIILIAARDELSEPILARSFTDKNASFEVNCSRFLKELEQKIRQLLDFLPEIDDTEKLARLTTSLLLSLNFRFNRLGNEQSSGDVTNAISHAYSLLIHHEFFHARIVQMGALKKSGYLRNLWWVIFIFDRFNAILNGKAMFINRLDFNLQRPKDIPHLKRLVELSYALEDTAIAGFRPSRGVENGIKMPKHVKGDPYFNPDEIIKDEVRLLSDLDGIRNVLELKETFNNDSQTHLPRIPVESYRDRFVFFLERLIRHQIILILRTGQFKLLREASQLDTFSLQLSSSLLKVFEILKGGQNHKLIMATPLIPSILLVAFSVPSFARYSILHNDKKNMITSPEVMDQIVTLSEDYLRELKVFSHKWFFVREVFDSLTKHHSRDLRKANEGAFPSLQYATPKKHWISINSIVSNKSDAEFMRSIISPVTSPLFHNDITGIAESNFEDKASTAKEEPTQQRELFSLESQLIPPVIESSRSRHEKEASNGDLNMDYNSSTGDGIENVCLADDVYFDISQLAEMVSTSANFIPNRRFGLQILQVMPDFIATQPTIISRILDKSTCVPRVGAFVWLAAFFIFLLSVTSKKSKKRPNESEELTHKHHALFPSIERPIVNQGIAEKPLVDAFPQPCSTGLTTRLLPFKNSKGEIEWVFTDDVQPNQEMDSLKGKVLNSKENPQRVKSETQPEILSPVTSNSSNNDSLSGKKPESSVSPQINTPSSTSSEDHKEDFQDGEGEILEDGEGGSHSHQCPHCDAKFRMRGYLTRHLKKHMSQKAYKCPFHRISIYKDENDNTHSCHPNGGFSRRDTYKTHLKTRHFKFPAGTPIKGRSKTPGNCAMCGEWFENAEIWSEIHVEGGECKYLPAGFQGKSRIKNKLKKQMARLMKEEKKSKSRPKKAPTEYLSPGTGTPNTGNTPSMSNPSQYDYDDSPTHSSCSSMGQHRTINNSLHDQFSREMQSRAMFANSPISEQNLVMTPVAQLEDYDDEFCLDTEQMSIFAMQPVFSPQQVSEYSSFPSPDYAIPNYSANNQNEYSAFIR
ncbi:hypothetical protein JCM33374_g5727 [Metschnikowia sp. JCM 33374]|nr:hypothetical protein JCM33374_g5727 [Metschnikowia sp. JCM 33374]